MTLDVGIHENIDADDYHGDPALSSGIAKLLVDRSPAHAWTAHPTLNPNWQPDIEEGRFDIGTAAHRLLLEGDDCIVQYVGTDWRTKDAKEFRDEVRRFGKVPLLTSQADRVYAMVEKGRMQMDEFYPDLGLFHHGKPEVTICWREGDVLCRARIDWLHDSLAFVDDYKTTSASADPRKWERTMYGMGADVQVAFYLRGLEAVTQQQWKASDFRFVVQETYEPYALSVVTLAPSALALAQDKVDKAINLWATCLERDFWPAYPTRVAAVEVPTWEEMRWLERRDDDA